MLLYDRPVEEPFKIQYFVKFLWPIKKIFSGASPPNPQVKKFSDTILYGGGV